MAGIPKYNIIPCCPDSGTQIEQFNIPDGPGGLVPDGVMFILNQILLLMEYHL